ENVDATLEASESSAGTLRAASPIARSATVHGLLTTDRPGSLSITLVAKPGSGAKGRVSLRVLSLGPSGTSDSCADAHRLLSAADAAYAAGQTVTREAAQTDGAKVDARKSYRAAADDYLAAARQLDSLQASLPLAQA